MARGVNKVILVGNLGAEPEVRSMPSGGTVMNLRLATTESWRDRQSGERQERTEWHRISIFGPLAEAVNQYLHKGSQVYIEGSIRTRKWQDKSGEDRYTTEIVGRELQILGSRRSADDNGAAPSHGESTGGGPVSGEGDAPSYSGETGFDDDIPF